jgi:hypothetical protein
MTTIDTTRIHSRAMLVTLNIGQWSARKIDKKAADDVRTANNATSNKGAYYKSLVEGGTLESIRKLATEVRHAHYRRTLPWSDTGPRVLSNTGFVDYMQMMSKYEQRFNQLVNDFVQEYPLLRHEAQVLLGSLFFNGDYPSIHHVQEKFTFKTTVTPLPMGDDFRCDLGQDEIDRIRAEITATTVATAQTAMKEAYTRVRDVVEKFVDRLEMPDTVFKTSMVDNARELADILPTLNFTDDPALTAIAEKLKSQLCAHEADALRNNVDIRKQAYEQAMDLKSDLMGFFNGDMA